MPNAKSNKETASNLFQKYSAIRKQHDPSNTFIQADSQIVLDKSFVYIQLLSKCDIHHNSLYKLLNIFRVKPEFCFSEIVKNPYKFVTIPDNILSFEKANEIADKYSVLNSIDKNTIYKAWIYDFILFKNNQFYISKSLLIPKFVNYFENADIQIVDTLCIKVPFEKKILYTLPELYQMEVCLGDDLIETFYNKVNNVNASEFISEYERNNTIIFTKNQRKAIQTAINNKLSIICGFPGTGKTTIADCICQYYKDKFICLTAPTGMAVNNIRNKCSTEKNIIGTIHKLLFDGFIDLKNEFPALMIVDEFSMVDVVLFHKIVQWCKVFDCKLILIADNQQLSPIGGGYPLGSFIQSKLFKITHLTNIKRQSKGNLKNVILKLSRNEPVIDSDIDKQTVFFYNYTINNLKKVIEKFDLSPTNTQFISPQHKHVEGTNNINTILQSIFSKNNSSLYCKQFCNAPNVIRENDLVVRTVNSYTSENELYANGDTAYITKNTTDNCIDVNYLHSKSKQQISLNDLYEEFCLAYCLTVHKVQGSQYDNVVLIIGNNHEFSWTNNDAKKLLYTAMSRARHRCFILGNPKLFTYAQSVQFIQKPSVLLKTFNQYEF